jgi:[ribosomal protein S5]-alanine N-acetyltransferase
MIKNVKFLFFGYGIFYIIFIEKENIMVQLFTERLLIRDHTLDDLYNYHELLSDSKSMRYLTFLKTSNLEESKQSLQKAIDEANSDDRKYYFFWIENKITKEYIGEVGYNVILSTLFGKIATIGYYIKENYWNNGYATEATKKIIDYAFTENNVYRFIGECIKENIGSENVMKKCGMIKEGEYKEYALNEDKLKDSVQYRLLKYEWKKLYGI